MNTRGKAAEKTHQLRNLIVRCENCGGTSSFYLSNSDDGPNGVYDEDGFSFCCSAATTTIRGTTDARATS